MTLLGTLALWLALLVGVWGALAGFVGGLNGRADLAHSARHAVFAMCGALLVAVVSLEWALFQHDFNVEYVAAYTSRNLPIFYTWSALYAGQKGSLLFWATVLSLFGSLALVLTPRRHSDLLPTVAGVVALVASFFISVMLFGHANPFHRLPYTPLDGSGLNPQLQNPGMVFHPPMLYLGYISITIPFAFAIAALLSKRLDADWLVAIRKWTLLSWLFLSIGICLGMWWAYVELGWGGYWAWDPVENASLLPWLTATAFIHSVIVQERRGMLRVWNLSLVIATFLTRSGILNSVHSFTQSAIGPTLLVFLGIVAATGIGLIAWRGDRLRTPGRIDSPVSRESAFLANNLLFAALAFVVLLGTVYPLIAEALQNKQLSVGEPYFNRMTTPLGIALLFLMAVAPALPWRQTSREVLRDRLLVSAWAGALAMVVAVALGARELAQVLAFGLGAFAVAAIARQYVIGLRGRRRATAEAWPVALVRMVRGNARLYGGLVVHVGVVIIAVAIASSSAYSTKREVRLTSGQSATVRGYTLTYTGSHTNRSGQKNTVTADVRIRRGGDDLGTYAPAISTFPNASEGIGTPSVRTGFREDVYL